MKKARVVSAIVMSVLLVVGIFAVSVSADKPTDKQDPPGQNTEPTSVKVVGAISGEDDPKIISMTISDNAFYLCDEEGQVRYDEEGNPICLESRSYVANPDREYPLLIGGVPKNMSLGYRYCDHVIHDNTTVICDVWVGNPDRVVTREESHENHNYKGLRISGGILNRKTGEIVWPKGSEWVLTQKTSIYPDRETGITLCSGILNMPVSYNVITWAP